VFVCSCGVLLMWCCACVLVWSWVEPQAARLEACAVGDRALTSIEEVEGVVARCGRAIEVAAAKEAMTSAKRLVSGAAPKEKGAGPPFLARCPRGACDCPLYIRF
jgi:formylmethanofuran:tetrahydromethanopterin formyltransferase